MKLIEMTTRAQIMLTTGFGKHDFPNTHETWALTLTKF